MLTKQKRWAALNQMHGACMICMVTHGSGAVIGMGNLPDLNKVTHKDQAMEKSAFVEAVVGATMHAAVVQHAATELVQTTLICVWASALFLWSNRGISILPFKLSA